MGLISIKNSLVEVKTGEPINIGCVTYLGAIGNDS